MVGSIVDMQARLTYVRIIAPPGRCCFINSEYGPSRLICTDYHGLFLQISWVEDYYKESFLFEMLKYLSHLKT